MNRLGNLNRELKSIDQLIVHAPHLDRNRITTTYEACKGRKRTRFDFIYRYHEDVLNPLSLGDNNLATILGLQPALNFFLFCKRVTIHGPVTPLDRALIRECALTSARDIYATRLQAENQFVRPAVRKAFTPKVGEITLPPLKFVNLISERSCRSEKYPQPISGTSCVLSSGGKESLLSYGILAEGGDGVHPVFLNEAGHHWSTALNAYRYFEKNIPNTTRIWTNTDRFYAWMHRHLSILKRGFERMRDAGYPVALWVLPPFILATLPLARKRRIECLVIGNEFDTSESVRTDGVRHFKGYYDQSIFFDQRMTKYFRSKGWKLTQVSIVRPLSEILIQRILCNRYPTLQVHQMSCHNARIRGARVVPCGACEKCCRIIGIMAASKKDPRRCGFRSTQIRAALTTLLQEGVSQEAVAVEHLQYLISNSELIRKFPELKRLACGQTFRPHPEVFALRFDRRRSPLNIIPVSIRAKVVRTLLSESDGCLVGSVEHGWRPAPVSKALNLEGL